MLKVKRVLYNGEHAVAYLVNENHVVIIKADNSHRFNIHTDDGTAEDVFNNNWLTNTCDTVVL